MMNESELIRLIQRWTGSPASPFGIGDDAALIPAGNKKVQAITTDFLVEGVDFKKTDSFKLIGRKVLAVNLSDLAAMGVKPSRALIYLAFPAGAARQHFAQFFQGWNGLAKKYGVSLIGGDLSRGKEWVAGAVLMGERQASRKFLRSGAKAGESLWVSGMLGGSILGKHFRFEPRVKEALFLREHFPVSACIDLSDGLAQDLPRLLQASKKGARIQPERIPISHAAKTLALKTKKTPLEHAFQDGEDFELLFTLNARYDERLPKLWKRKFRTPLTKIGTITASRRIECFFGGKIKKLPASFWQGFDHFRSFK